MKRLNCFLEEKQSARENKNEDILIPVIDRLLSANPNISRLTTPLSKIQYFFTNFDIITNNKKDINNTRNALSHLKLIVKWNMDVLEKQKGERRAATCWDHGHRGIY